MIDLNELKNYSLGKIDVNEEGKATKIHLEYTGDGDSKPEIILNKIQVDKIIEEIFSLDTKLRDIESVFYNIYDPKTGEKIHIKRERRVVRVVNE